MTVSAPATRAFAISPEYCRPPSAMTGMPASRAGLVGLPDRGHLRNAHARDDARRADRARADADLDGIHPGVDERLGTLAGGDVAADDVDVRERLVGLEATDHVDDALGLPVGGVDDDDVHTRVAEGLGAFPGVAEEADGRTDAQASLVVLRGEGVLLALVEVLDRDETGELAVVVDERQLLDAVLREQGDDLVGADADAPGHEALARHDVAHLRRLALETRDEAHVAVGDDAEEAARPRPRREGPRCGTGRTACRPPRSSRRASS